MYNSRLPDVVVVALYFPMYRNTAMASIVEMNEIVVKSYTIQFIVHFRKGEVGDIIQTASWTLCFVRIHGAVLCC